MSELFGLGDLSGAEKVLALQAMIELQRDGYIVQIPFVKEEFNFGLTDEGGKLAKQTLDDMNLTT
jgi:hypothetical protein